MEYEIVYPIAMDDFAWFEAASKGWLAVTVRWARGERTLLFYDPIRLAQDVQADLKHNGYFAERIVVVPDLTAPVVESTVATLAQHGFAGLP